MPRLLLTVLALTLSTALAQPDPPRAEVRLAVLSDFNGPYGATDYPAALGPVLRAITEVWRPDLLLMPGDLVAGQSAALPEARFAEMWQAFDTRVAAPLRAAGIPYAATIGNHDGSSLRLADGSFAFARERAAARAYWTQPMYQRNLAYQDRSGAPFDYSFAFGGLFVAVIDASSATLASAQLEWLQGQLSSPAARAAAYRLVVGHLPLFGVSEAKNRPGEVLSGGAELARRFATWGADLYLSGHHAAYYPGQAGGLTLIANGGIGARRLLGSAAAPRSSVTVLDFTLAPPRLAVRAFDAESLEEIPIESLPARLDGLGGSVTRLDLKARP